MGENQSSGSISACYATGNATEALRAGGLVGKNEGTISMCYATGNVTTAPAGYAGGLVGWNTSASSAILACYATGNARAEDNGSVGGLVGNNAGTIRASYARGIPTATGSGVGRGGLIGKKQQCDCDGYDQLL